MTELLTITLDGHIVPKPRIRFKDKRGFHKNEYALNQAYLRVLFRQAIRGRDGFPYEGNVRLDVVFYRKGTGDFDNLAGAVAEALQGKTPYGKKGKSRKPEGIVIKNDSQIREAFIKILPADGDEKCEITIKEVG